MMNSIAAGVLVLGEANGVTMCVIENAESGSSKDLAKCSKVCSSDNKLKNPSPAGRGGNGFRRASTKLKDSPPKD